MEARRAPPPASDIPVALADHAVLVGYGRVGQVVARDLLRGGTPVVVEVDAEAAAKGRSGYACSLSGLSWTRGVSNPLQSAPRSLSGRIVIAAEVGN